MFPVRSESRLLPLLISATLIAVTPVLPASADVSIGDWVVREGNTIRVVGPHPSVDLQQIVDDIVGATATNRYQIKLGPGVYELGLSEILILKEYVDLAGSGQETTEIVGNRTSGGGTCGSAGGQGVVATTDNSVLSDLTVTNDSTSSANGYAVCNVPNNSPTIRRVTAKTTSDSFGGSRFAIRLNTGSPTLIDVTAIADNGNNAYALYCSSSTPDVSRAWLTAKNGVARNRAVWLVGTCSIETRDLVIVAEDSPINVGIEAQVGTEINVTRGSISATGAGVNIGIKVAGDGKSVLHEVQIRPSGGSSNRGMELDGTADVQLLRGTVSGSTAGIDSDSTVTTFISQSTIADGVVGTGTLSCVASDDGQGTALASDCTPVP